jgi:hypothetical protein
MEALKHNVEELRIEMMMNQNREGESMHQLLIKEVELTTGNKLQEMLKNLKAAQPLLLETWTKTSPTGAWRPE